MLTFQYSAKTANGKQTKGIVHAETESAAAKLIISKGFMPLDIHLQGQNNSILFKLTNRISTKDRIIFTRQLATLINAGLPLTQSLRTVSEQSRSKALSVIINEVITSVEGGVTLSESLAKHPKVFSDVYVALVAAGESSGTLDLALERIATQQEKDADMISKVRGALVYPLIVLFVIGGVVIFLLTTVVPQIELIYKDFNKDLPFFTNILIKTANIIINYWMYILIGIGVALYFGIKWFQTKEGGVVADRIKLKMPIFGDLFTKLYMARFCRTGQTLMASGVPMLQMMRITSRAVDNVHVESAIARASEKVKGGKGLSSALKDETVFLSLVPQMLKIGEQSGSIDKMMDKAATYYEDELDAKIKTISTTIEPILMVFLAIVVGGIVGAILVPVYNLASESIAT
ncbi:type II secretion system F family protein [Candidatus Saccharibacteria bacterium]|nr:type II secretion system F family protein [Candidatus Saccharibacteria bacterium]